MTKEMEEYFDEMTKGLISVWEDFYAQMDEHMERMQEQNADNYQKMLDAWKDHSQRITAEKESLESDVHTFRDFTETLQEWVNASSEFGRIMDDLSPTDFSGDFDDMHSKYMENLRVLLLKNLELSWKKHMEKQKELYDQWMVDMWTNLKDEDDETPLGSPMDLQDNWIEFSKDFFDMWEKNFEKGEPEDMLHDTQRDMVRLASKNIENILTSEPYAMFQGSYLDNVLDTKITQKELMDTYMESLNLPSRNDILEVYEAIHELTSRVRKLERKLDEIPVDV